MIRKTIALLYSVILITASLSFYACDKEDDEDEDSDETTNTPTSSGGGGTNYEATNSLFLAADSVGPKITATDSANLTGWESGNVLYEIFGLVRPYDDEIDSGKIDGSNMYKALYDAGGYVDSAYRSCSDIDETPIASPFDYGDDLIADHTYDCAYDNTSTSGENTYNNSYAVKLDADLVEQKALIGSFVSEPPSTGSTLHETSISVQVDNNTSTNEITVNQAYWVNYGTSDYAVRLYLSGNSDTGLFTLKLIKGGSSESASSTSIAGYGYSKGGADAYYLFRVTTTGSGSDVTNAYFCFTSDSDEDDLQALDAAGSSTVPADCSAYEDFLPTANYTTDDLPLASTDFNGGGDNGIDLQY